MIDIDHFLKPLYKRDAARVMEEINTVYKHARRKRVHQPNYHWYKFINMSFVYPHGVRIHPEFSPLQNLSLYFEHIKHLGCNAVHILPFLESPLVDAGFDISDYFKVRKDLGSFQDLKQLVVFAKHLHLHLFMDLVFNHVSEEHEWFKKAENGDEKYREYFLYTKTKPVFIKRYKKESAVWADYQVNGDIVSVNIAFPEYTGEIPHFRQGKDGFWYYHTYYPQQLDLNWFNPDVFIEFAKIVIYWAQFGFNFRLDAIPFVGKKLYKPTDGGNEYTHLITSALKNIAEAINPECVFIVETYESMKSTIAYFGTTNFVESNLSYNFHLCSNIWVSLVKKDQSYIWNKLDEMNAVPKHSEWMNFLRNHDELSLAYLSDSLIGDIRKSILTRGAPFREEFGISGRTYSLLGKSTKRFLMAYFLLASFPGGMVIPYGDELGLTNIPLKKLPLPNRSDTRNINRGVITPKIMNDKKGKKIYECLQYILEKRRHLYGYLNVWPEKLGNGREVFGALYTLGSSQLAILINLSSKKQEVSFVNIGDYKSIAKINTVRIKKRALTLGPYGGIWLQK